MNNNDPEGVRMILKTAEHLLECTEPDWPTWRCLNHLQTGVVKTKVNMQLWGYSKDTNNLCEYAGNFETTEHLLVCPHIGQSYTNEDLTKATVQAILCVHFWTQTGHQKMTAARPLTNHLSSHSFRL